MKKISYLYITHIFKKSIQNCKEGVNDVMQATRKTNKVYVVITQTGTILSRILKLITGRTSKKQELLTQHWF